MSPWPSDPCAPVGPNQVDDDQHWVDNQCKSTSPRVEIRIDLDTWNVHLWWDTNVQQKCICKSCVYLMYIMYIYIYVYAP